jgi:hypothetical protein
MRFMKPIVSATMVLACVTATPVLLTAQTYICTTTTRTTTYYSHDDMGNLYETTVTVSSRVCIPQET